MADSSTIISNSCNDDTSESLTFPQPHQQPPSSSTLLLEHQHREKVKEPTPPRSIPSLLEKVLPSHSTLPKDKESNSTSSSCSSRNSIKRKSATLAITPSAGNNNNHHHDSNSLSNSSSTTSNGHQFSRSGTFRRSFTLPRSLLLRKSGQTGPVSGNNGNFVRSIFLTFVKSRSSTRKKKDTTENEDPVSASTIQDTTDSATLPTLGLPPGFVPAAVGLKNQGNTCFMNAIVQCLSHTDVLAKYLVTDAYKSDLRKKYWIKNGKGEVTEELASILKSTWFRMNSSVLEEAASKFKSAVERGASQWRGSEQHDAQEFLLWLLDRLHEDLNQAASNKYKPVKNNFGRPDEQVAAEALANHVRCNNSIIHEIFGAQFRSSLTCPGCGRQSATFDPFLCVSLPIPEGKQEVPVYINILYLSQQPRLVKLGLSVSASADIKELKQLLSADTEISENQILLAEIDGEGFHRTFTETQLVSVLSSNEALYCIETPEPKEINETDGAFLMITWTNILISNDGSTRVRFGSPYITQVSREIGYMDLQKILLKEMAAIVQIGVLVADQKEPVFSIRILDGTSEGCLIDPEVEHPLYMEAIDHALCLCDEDVPTHIKVQLEWNSDRKEKLIADDLESIEEHSSVTQVRQRYSEEPVSTVTLGECFDLYTKAEQLSAEDSWHCPHCNRKEQGTLKMIGLWTAPQILVVHLKRFRQVTKLRHTVTKISSVVEFPVEGLDLGHYVSKRNRAAHHLDASNLSLNQTSPINGCFSLGSWKQRASFKKHLANSNHAAQAYSRGMNGYQNGANGTVTDDSGMTYDLFAVCNHHGKDLQGGHYTAYCKNPVDNSWWLFDDTRVNQLDSAADVNTASAYILFYQRRSLSGGPYLNNANNITNHWCRNLLKKHVRTYNQVTSNTPSINGTESATSKTPITTNGHVKEEGSEQKSGQGAPLARMEDEQEDCNSNNNPTLKHNLTNGISCSPHQPHELQIESTV